MSLSPGTRIGPYEVAAQIGAGGMGEVYRAIDSRLKRHVALKVLPASVALDADRLARFRREAEVLASLNHPNIAAIYGFERENGIDALVMELVDGPTLEDRIERGAVPLDEALAVAKQIAEALEAAHEQGVIHRDLKPSNIKVRPDGAAKVLDFGLAKAIEPEGLLQPEADAHTPSMAPTVTSPAMTQAGVILGTAAYMSPEQARGRAVDKRADIWAFGCVLFEMLTGQRAFKGEDVADTLGAVIHKSPDWKRLPISTPPAVRRLLERCLQKDPRRRLRDMGEARIVLEEPDALPVLSGSSTWKGWTIAAIVALVASAVTAIVMRSAAPSVAEPASFRLAVPLAAGESAVPLQGLALSPDGRSVAFVSRVGREAPRLVVRHLDDSPDVVFDDTSEASSPFFSPDNRWLGYFATTTLKKVPVGGGAPQVITTKATGSGAAWAGDGVIYFAANDGIWRIPADGGEAERVTTLRRDRGEVGHLWPRLVPGTDLLLYVVWTGPGWEERHIVARHLTTDQETIVVRGAATVRFVESGHLVYTRAGRLTAVPFDTQTLQLTGPPVDLLDDVREGPASADYDVSVAGTFAYIHQSRGAFNRVPVLVDRTGMGQPLPGVPPGFYQNPRFSPDGRRVLLHRNDGTVDMWLYDFARQTFTVMRSEGSNQLPAWSPDGKSIVYRGTRKGLRNLFIRPVDDIGSETRVTTSEHLQMPWSWEGETIAFQEGGAETQGDIWLLPLSGTREPRVLVRTGFDETKARLSPNGKTVVYVSDESGQDQIYGQLVDASRREQLSTDGGTDPVWARSGRELYYRSGRRVMVLEMAEEGRPKSGPRVLFEGDYVITSPALDFDVSPDGSHFLMIRTSEPEPPRSHIELFLNWQKTLAGPRR